MNLRFLGQTYSASNDLVPTVAIPRVACFRGQSYTLRRPVPTVQLKSGWEFKKYRGVVYYTK